MTDPTLYVVPLSITSAERLQDFDCGDEPWSADLNDFIRNDALVHQDKKLNRTYLFLNETGECAGFVTVLASTVRIASTGMTRRQLHYGEIPTLLVGRFAIHATLRGQAVAPYLMAWTRQLARNLPIGCRFLALHVERENERAVRFYERERFFHTPPQYEPDNPMRLMLYDLLER